MEELVATVKRFKQTILKATLRRDGYLSSRHCVLRALTRYEWWRFYLNYFHDCATDPDWITAGSTSWWFKTISGTRILSRLPLWAAVILLYLILCLFSSTWEPPQANTDDWLPTEKPFVPAPKVEQGGCARSDSTVPAI